jgi:HK97 family phage prohead protease
MYKVKSNYELKDLDEKSGVIQAYVSIFGNIDSDGDMVVPGAFKKTISERGPESEQPRIKHLWQHSPWEVIGIPQAMSEDTKGLLVTSKFGSDQFSQDKLQQHKDGLITEFSIGYNVIKEKAIRTDNEYNELQELKLWEYSSVTWGANSLTHVVDAKSDTDTVLERLNDRMDKLTKALRNGKYTDESSEAFEVELKQIQTIYNELIKGNEPGEPTRREPGDDPTLSDQDVIEIFKSFKI